ncbi:hypothetical protein CSOJ01_10342 [Colletotrichum sojae]|uniref:Protein BTN n=1 Tax=Colletotrichum sojae TaxID=2175907 RepID=A0A8H6J173_9PEZI|nr:hypothetical protein CSOJ01_10342 [Colletotrichum sojae]
MSSGLLDSPLANQHRVRTFLGFALIGLANIVLARISHAANYLIVPYPQAVVLLLELLPAALAKLFLPFVLGYIPQGLRPVLLAGLWVLIKIIVSATPPNVLPPVRVLTTALAAACSAATELCCLDLARRYGRHALAAWAIGTSLGQIANATWPLVLTSSMGMTLREATGYMYQLVAAILVAYFVVLPKALPPAGFAGLGLDSNDTTTYYTTSLTEDASATPDKVTRKPARNARALPALAVQYLLTLLLASAAQAMVFPGIAFALDGSAFSSLLSWTSALAFALYLGNFAARSLSATSLRLGSHRVVLILLAWMVALLPADSIFFLGHSWVVLCVGLGAGLLGGAVYVEVFDGVLTGLSGHPDCVLILGIVGAGDTIGSLLGGLVGVLWQGMICGMTVDAGRFCHRPSWS